MKYSCKILAIGGSAGSLEVLLKVLPRLKEEISFSIIIVLHRKNSADSALSDLFSTRTKISVYEVEDKQSIVPGNIYIAPADYHLLIEKNISFSLDFSEKVNYSRPSIDVTFESAADVFNKDLICLLLSGANMDGSNGLKAAKENGAVTLVQDPETAESQIMPSIAIKNNKIDHILTPDQMVTFINSINV